SVLSAISRRRRPSRCSRVSCSEAPGTARARPTAPTPCPPDPMRSASRSARSSRRRRRSGSQARTSRTKTPTRSICPRRSPRGGRFFRAVRGESALAYQVTSFHRSRLDAGNFIAYTATAPENEGRARDLLLGEIALLQREPASAEELAAAKAAILGEHVIGTQTFGAQAGELAAVGVFGLPPDEPQRYLARIEAGTADEVRDVARRYRH